MSRFKILKFLKIIFVVLLFLIILNLLLKGRAGTTVDMVSGYVSNLTDTSEKRYNESFIDSYDAELSWQPGELFGTANQPDIIGESAILVDIDSGKILFEKNSSQRRKIASLTKIMTAVVALEHRSLDTKIKVSAKAANIGENSMGVSEGEIYTLNELLHGLIMNSGNDAAYAIAEGTAGSSETFVKWMNFKARDLGLKDTYFADPSGLDDSTYSTAADLVRLTRYALKNPRFREVAKTVEYEVIGDEHKYIPLYNQTNLLTTYPGVAGVKTGFTEEAGLCLVTYASNGGYEVVGVVLNSVDRKGDMILMLDHGFASLGIFVEHHLLD
jgi:D-alanyl-D-alanine carboxypeptidase (penicillin-binding protein 5/6)